MTTYQAPQIEWMDFDISNADQVASKLSTVTHDYTLQFDRNNKIVACYYNKQTRQSEPYITAPRFDTIEDAKEWVEQTHYPSALVKAGFKPVSEPLSDATNKDNSNGV